MLLNIGSLLLSFALAELGDRFPTNFFSPSTDCGLCGDDDEPLLLLLLCASLGGDVDSLIAWLLTSNFTFVLV